MASTLFYGVSYSSGLDTGFQRTLCGLIMHAGLKMRQRQPCKLKNVRFTSLCVPITEEWLQVAWNHWQKGRKWPMANGLEPHSHSAVSAKKPHGTKLSPAFWPHEAQKPSAFDRENAKKNGKSAVLAQK